MKPLYMEWADGKEWDLSSYKIFLDTIQKVMGMIRPENLQQLQNRWQELLNSNEGEKLKKIICVDGKTMRGNKRKDSKPCHIVSAWSREDGYCLGQKAIAEVIRKRRGDYVLAVKGNQGTLEEYRYYISSLTEDIELFRRAVRGHWAVESMLKLIEIWGQKMSLRRKGFNISFAPGQFIDELMKI